MFNLLYTRFIWRKDLEENATLLVDLQDCQYSSDALYFAESSNSNIASTDSLELRISDFIDRNLPEIRVGSVDHAGYHAGHFLPVIKRIDPSGPVRMLIVTMNLRTFGSDVIYSPNSASMFKSSRLSEPAPPLMNRLLTSLNYYDNRSGHELDILKWEDWVYDTLKSTEPGITFPYNTTKAWCEVVKFPDSTGQEDMHRRILADQNIKVYAFEITEENEIVQVFDKIAEIARKKDLRLVYNILAENIEQTDSLVGDNLVWLMKKNRDFLMDRYSSKGVLVVDNLGAVSNEHFNEREVFPTEHYDQTGRQIIARNVADSILRRFPDLANKGNRP